MTFLFIAGCARSPKLNGEVAEPSGPALELTGVKWNGRRFHLSDLRGKVSYYPDVCPFTLSEMKQLYRDLRPGAPDPGIPRLT